MTKKELPKEDIGSIEVVERTALHRGFVSLEKLSYRCRAFTGETRLVKDHEVLLRTPAVVVLPYDPVADTVVLVEQYRSGPVAAGYSPACLREVVAGMLDSGEQPLDSAQRELAEETGLQAQTWIPIARYWVSPGATTERIDAFCAVVDSSSAASFAGVKAEGEDLRTVVLKREQALANCMQAVFANSATLICLQWLSLHVNDLREQC